MRQTNRRRADQLLVERGLAETRQKAQALLIAGQVLFDEQRVDKPGQLVDAGSVIRILGELKYVSRAGAKLEAALDHFGIDVAGRVCADLGASTGGFTDCLLQRGAREVHAFDVGRGQLAWKLQSDTRVVVHDGFNVRRLSASDLPADVSVVTADLSFISLTKVLPALRAALGADPVRPIDLVLLVKPQFEVGPADVGKGGIVRDEAKQAQALSGVARFAAGAGFAVAGSVESPVRGAKGNREFLLYLRLGRSMIRT